MKQGKKPRRVFRNSDGRCWQPTATCVLRLSAKVTLRVQTHGGRARQQLCCASPSGTRPEKSFWKSVWGVM